MKQNFLYITNEFNFFLKILFSENPKKLSKKEDREYKLNFLTNREYEVT